VSVTSDDRNGRQRLRVALIAAPRVVGGVTGHLLGLATHLPGSIRPLCVLPDRPALEPAARAIASTGVAVGTLPEWPWRNGGGTSHAAWLESLGADLLHLHFSRPGDLTPLIEAAARAGIPVVTTDHMVAGGAWDGCDAAAYTRRRVASSHVAAAIADSEAVRQGLVEVVGLAPQGVRVVHHGIDTRRFVPGRRRQLRARLGLLDDVPLLGTGGLLVSAKGVHRVIDAFAAVAHRDGSGSPRLVVLGDGPERPRLEAMVRNAGADVAELVRFTGWRDDVEYWLAALDALIHAPDTEGLPSLLLEAMACGCAVIATAVGGIPELLDHGRRGRLVDPGDQEALQRCVMETVAGSGGRARGRTSEDRQRLHDAREAVRELYSIELTARRIAEVLHLVAD
jgi:glycosyltransferase involved in cell wall biosynthesis